MAAPKLTIWYNTKCPVCNRGIERQNRRLMRSVRSGAIAFRDINLEPEALVRFCAGIEDVRRRLHGVDSEDRLYLGADCVNRNLEAHARRFLAGSSVDVACSAADDPLRIRPFRRPPLRLEPPPEALVKSRPIADAVRLSVVQASSSPGLSIVLRGTGDGTTLIFRP
jgi:predicted DCC family thiol-disulfide oxidoreductase YuxK